MGEPALTGIRACVFDAYGTLFDVGSAAARCADALGGRLDAVNALWRERQLQYAWLRSLQGRHADFWQVTGDALDFTLESLGIDDPALRQRLMDMYRTVRAYPDVAAALARIKELGMRTAVLSNGSPPMLHAAVESAKLSHLLDDVISVEAVGVYKPHPKVYQLAVDRLAAPPAGISFQSSNGWDVYAASAFGLRTVWCNRHGQPRERLPGKPDFEIGSLAELAGLLGAGRPPTP